MLECGSEKGGEGGGVPVLSLTCVLNVNKSRSTSLYVACRFNQSVFCSTILLLCSFTRRKNKIQNKEKRTKKEKERTCKYFITFTVFALFPSALLGKLVLHAIFLEVILFSARDNRGIHPRGNILTLNGRSMSTVIHLHHQCLGQQLRRTVQLLKEVRSEKGSETSPR